MQLIRAAVSVATGTALALVLSAGPALAGTPQGLKGYEGQPGHQAGQQGGGSNSCAPGQHGNPKPGFKPGSC